MSGFVFETVPKIVCECGAVSQLGALARALAMHRVMVVSDRGLVQAGLTNAAMASLEAAGVEAMLFADVCADPPEDSVMAAVALAQTQHVDGVIGLGGGSSLDTAKLVALLARTAQPLQEIYGIGLARGPRWPLIQVPTTAGTGSEVTPIAILTTVTNEKKGVVSPLLYPDIAVLDAELTLGLPAALTAITGVDAMVHAIEAYTTRLKKNPLSDALALQALQRLYTNLPTVMARGDDLVAREHMLTGSLMAGMAFANAPVGAVHALAYPLGGRFHLPHGLANALVLVPTLEFNRPAASGLYAELGCAMVPALTGHGDDAASLGLIDALRTLIASLPCAQRLRDTGIALTDLPTLAQDAMQVQRLLVNNPRELNFADALAIYQAAF